MSIAGSSIGFLTHAPAANKIEPWDSAKPGESMSEFDRMIDGSVTGSQYVRSVCQPWEPTELPGFWLKRLYENYQRGEKTWLMKVDPGAVSDAHAHDEFEQFYVLEGRLIDDSGVLEAGDFVCRAPGDMHSARSDVGALVLLVYTRHDPSSANG